MNITFTELLLLLILFVLFVILASTVKIASRMNGHKAEVRNDVSTRERFIIDEENDIVIDTEMGTKMNIFQYNNLLASTDDAGFEDEDNDIE